MIKKENNDDKISREYLYYLMNDLGLLNDYAFEELNISFNEYDSPNKDTFEKIENYIDKNSKN